MPVTVNRSVFKATEYLTTYSSDERISMSDN